MSESEHFQRTDRPFFHSDAVKRAITALSESERLVIYCGAGVTIDRTGLSWERLAEKVYKPVNDDDRFTPHPSESDIAHLKAAVDPTQLASILHQYGVDRGGAKRSSTASRVAAQLQRLLYDEAAWRAGRLANAVAGLAYSTAAVKQRAVVVTSNYDTHIEDEILAQIRDSGSDSAPLDSQTPVGLFHITYGDAAQTENRNTAVKEPARGQGDREFECYVDIHYLHGRVPEDHQPTGHIVINEVDYAETRDGTRATLHQLFQEADAVLIVGASLTDPPLIEALADSRAQPNRFCLIPVGYTGIAHLPPGDVGRLKRHLQQRGRCLGLTFLFPDFTCQVAQFCEEVELRYDQPDSASSGRYGQRLVRWWDEWSRASAAGSGTNAEDELAEANKPFAGLVQALEDVKSVAHDRSLDHKGTHAREVLRAELWVRSEPKGERRLTMWANTAGPILDRDVMSTAELDVHSSHASVRAFIDGRPQHMDRDELEDNARQSLQSTHDLRPFRYRTRWVSYLAVPITVAVGEGRVTVGVVTISSTLPRKESLLRADAATMADIVALLRLAGKDLLEMPTLVPTE